MKKSIKIAALFVAAAISVAVVSCQKDNETEENVVAKSANKESKELLNRIYAFQELKDNINAGEKSNGSMSLQEMRDNIDLTFNYEHSQHATPFANATLDTFYVAMPTLDANGNVTEADAIATYNAFETNLEKLLASVDDDMNLAKNFSIKLPEAGAKSGNDIEVVFTLGTEGERHPWFTPFKEGDDFIWGYNLGRCDHGLSEVTDAAEELTKKIHQNSPVSKYYTPYRIQYVEFTPFEDNYYLDDHIYIEQDNVPYSYIYWLFRISGDFEEEPCIYYYELNQEYNNFWATHINPNGQYHYHPQNGLPYYDAFIEAIDLYGYDVKRIVRLHKATVGYAKYFVTEE